MNTAVEVPVKQGAVTAPKPFPDMFGPLQRQIDRLFEDFAPAFNVGRPVADLRARMDLAETKDGLELTIELPGLEEKDVDVSVSDGILTVSGEKKFETEQKEKTYQFVERSYGSFSRSIGLPSGVTPDQIKATMSKGVLKVTVPMPAKPAPQKIAVQAG
ncbi:MAG TPA: Hsp20/alpha crystallin family protein [Caulobacteraceae bacterium]|nr:Hsp20/alpha crystallin family protein [Caulobacteraceae bacterium]